MKTQFLFLIVCIINVGLVNAQMDDKFYYPKKDLKPIEWKNQEELKLQVDTDTIHALFVKSETKPKATIFYFQGAGGNYTNYFPLAKMLAKEGFQVVMINFRGYGKSTGTPTHLNIAKDGQQILDLLLKHKGIKNTKKIIYGLSIGSQIATHLAKTNQDVIDGLILEGTISSFGDIAAFYTPQFKEYLINNYKSPYAAKEDIKSLDKISKLFIHSKEDKEVPFSMGETVYNNAPEPKTFLEFKGEHLHGLKYEGEQIIKKINEMIN